MKRIAHKTALHAMGWIFIIIGILGLILPIIPGLAFMLLGLYFFSLASLWFWTKLESQKTRYPRIWEYFLYFDTKISRFVKKAHY
jgi:uncharacterized membrane protein YbaN (DUF454 family)